MVVYHSTPSLFSRLLPSTDATANALQSDLMSDCETDGEAEPEWYEWYREEDDPEGDFLPQDDALPDDKVEIAAPNRGIVEDGGRVEMPGSVDNVPPPPEPLEVSASPE